MPMIPLSGWQECQDSISALLAGSEPSFIGRMGGSDTDALAAMIEGALHDEVSSRTAALRHLPLVKRFNGYYDHTNNPDNYLRFLELLRTSYLATSNLALVDSKLLSMYFPNNLNPAHILADIPYVKALGFLVNQVDEAQGDWIAYPYTFFETLMGRLNLFRVFERVLPGATVVVASPFTESIKRNWPHRQQFFANFKYPEFSLKLLNTPITYDGLPRDMYPHENWFDTLDALKTELSGIKYDILLLSCGSYAMPLGLHSRDVLHRRAIYVGGVLQLFFGVIGRRYQGPFFLNSINQEAFIQPIERDMYLRHVTINSDTAKEAFGAYF
jgi:hypothetical protein